VLSTLQSLGAKDKPIVTIFNKTDRIEDRANIDRLVAEFPNSVAISAKTGRGIPDLLHLVKENIQNMLGLVEAIVPYSESALVQECYDYGRVLEAEYKEDGIHVRAELVAEMRDRLKRYARSTGP
jgi:GTP-binding protein HflX